VISHTKSPLFDEIVRTRAIARSIACIDLSSRRRSAFRLVRDEAISDQQRMVFSLELEFRRFLLLSRLVGRMPYVSELLRTYSGLDPERHHEDGSRARTMSLEESQEHYARVIPYGNPHLFFGMSPKESLTASIPSYRIRCGSKQKNVSWRMPALPIGFRESLQADCILMHQYSQADSSDSRGVTSEGKLYSPRRTSFAISQGVAWSLLSSTRLTAQIANRVGEPVQLVKTSYLYYAKGDFQEIHTDGPQCKYVLLTAMQGKPEPLTVYPELQGLSDDSLLLRSAAMQRPQDGNCVGIDQLPVLLRGAEVPHARHRCPRSAFAVLAACYDHIC